MHTKREEIGRVEYLFTALYFWYYWWSTSITTSINKFELIWSIQKNKLYLFRSPSKNKKKPDH